jgi:hypothetical protein
MLKMDSDWARAIIGVLNEELIEKSEPIPEALVRGMFLHVAFDVAIDSRPKSLAEYIANYFVHILMDKYNIICTGSKVLEDLPLRNSRIYEHSYRTKDNEVFYAYQIGCAPINSIEQLTSSIMELHTNSGCIACKFTGFIEDDIECHLCRNGAARRLITENKNIKSFKKHGWHKLSEVIGKNNASILFDFSKFYHLFFSDMGSFLSETIEIIEAHQKNNKIGSYFKSEIEHDIFLIANKKLLNEEEDDEESFD